MMIACSELEGPRGLEQLFPPEVEFVLSALEAGPRPAVDRQKRPRIRHRVRAMLRLFSDAQSSPPRRLYTRQVNTHAIGFLSSECVPVSHGGVVEMPDLAGRPMRIYCTVLRCRQAAPGWFEGALCFNREQAAFWAAGSRE